jgi:hypothetical protein
MAQVQQLPFTPKSSLVFVVITTLVALLVGSLTQQGILPLTERINYSETASQFLSYWMMVAVGLGLVLPLLVWIYWWRDQELRYLWGLYLAVLVVQILTEQLLSAVWISSLVVTIGTIYTAFRIWQLITLQRLFSPQSSLKVPQKGFQRVLAWLLLPYLGANLIFLVTTAWSTILQS